MSESTKISISTSNADDSTSECSHFGQRQLSDRLSQMGYNTTCPHMSDWTEARGCARNCHSQAINRYIVISIYKPIDIPICRRYCPIHFLRASLISIRNIEVPSEKYRYYDISISYRPSLDTRAGAALVDSNHGQRLYYTALLVCRRSMGGELL